MKGVLWHDTFEPVAVRDRESNMQIWNFPAMQLRLEAKRFACVRHLHKTSNSCLAVPTGMHDAASVHQHIVRNVKDIVAPRLIYAEWYVKLASQLRQRM